MTQFSKLIKRILNKTFNKKFESLIKENFCAFFNISDFLLFSYVRKWNPFFKILYDFGKANLQIKTL